MYIILLLLQAVYSIHYSFERHRDHSVINISGRGITSLDPNIDLRNCNVASESLEVLSGLKSLRTLDPRDNENITTLPSCIKEWSRDLALDLRGCPIIDLDGKDSFITGAIKSTIDGLMSNIYSPNNSIQSNTCGKDRVLQESLEEAHCCFMRGWNKESGANVYGL